MSKKWTAGKHACDIPMYSLQEVDQLRRAGNVKCARDEYTEAVQLFSDGLKLKPDALQLLINRALCLIVKGDPVGAVRPLAACGMARPAFILCRKIARQSIFSTLFRIQTMEAKVFLQDSDQDPDHERSNLVGTHILRRDSGSSTTSWTSAC